MKRTIDYINKNFPKIFTIADAKRGDIGNTSKMYAQTFFANMNFDSVTINPYMGSDSVKPFLEFENKTSILLGLTSNSGALDIQLKKTNQDYVFIEMIKSSMNWGNEENMMYVVGATKPQYIEKIRELIPNHFLLMPGVGAQGGDLNEICKYAINDNIGVLVNSSRSIIYASQEKNFADKAASEAIKLQGKMKIILSQEK
jgi:orotidine-5'-phosphate decarboxylase